MKYNFISIRGTNGAGKSTLTRKLLKECIDVKPFYIEGRKKPAYYLAGFEQPDLTIVTLGILGHYEGDAGGGCDNLSTTDQYYDLAHKCLSEHGVNCVIAEGMICSKEFSRIQDVRLSPALLFLDVPQSECFAGVQQRRIDAQKSVGRDEVKLQATIADNYKGVASSCKRLAALGYPLVTLHNREEYWDALVKLLGEE